MMDAAREGVAKYLGEYSSSLDEIVGTLISGGVTGRLTCANLSEVSSSVKVALLYRDTTILDLTKIKSDSLVMSWLGPKFFERAVDEPNIKIHVPAGTDDAVIRNISASRIGLAFMAPSGDIFEQLFNDIAPLIFSGSVLIMPRRLLLHYDQAADGSRKWEALEADNSALIDSLNLVGESKREEEPTFTSSALVGTQSPQGIDQVFSEIVLPYIENVSLQDYQKILTDENDIIVEFRAALNELVVEARKAGSIEEFRLDVIEPRIAKIDRSFKRISSQYRLRSGGAVVATAALTLVSYSMGGAAAAIAAAAGTAGFVSATKEWADGTEKLSSLKDDPLHLLWRLQSNRRGSI